MSDLEPTPWRDPDGWSVPGESAPPPVRAELGERPGARARRARAARPTRAPLTPLAPIPAGEPERSIVVRLDEAVEALRRARVTARQRQFDHAYAHVDEAADVLELVLEEIERDPGGGGRG